MHCTGRDLSRSLAAKTVHCMRAIMQLTLSTYAVGVADIAAREGSPHNVLHSSSFSNTSIMCKSREFN